MRNVLNPLFWAQPGWWQWIKRRDLLEVNPW